MNPLNEYLLNNGYVPRDGARKVQEQKDKQKQIHPQHLLSNE